MHCNPRTFFQLHPTRLCLFFFAAIVLMLQACSSTKTIVNGISEREANEMIVLLDSKGIEAIKVQSAIGAGGGGQQAVVLWDIQVPADRSVEAMRLLDQAGLPRKQGQNLLQIFSGTGLVPTEMEQRIRYEAGLAGQIANTIKQIDGVIDANVVLAFPPENPLNPTAPKEPVTASVYVKNNGVLNNPNSHLIEKIKQLVSASVPGLNYNNVTVVSDVVNTGENPLLPQNIPQPPEWVSDWSIIIAKDSVTRFRVIFFILLLSDLFFILLVIWLLWKIFPYLKKHGFLSLVTPHHFEVTPKEEHPVIVEKAEEGEAKKEEEEQSKKEREDI